MRKTLVVLIACFIQFSGGLMAQSSAKTHVTKKETPTQNVALSVDQARLIVKEIPSVNVASTISRWKLEEPDLVKLRRWAQLLVEDPAANGFQPRWSEFLTQMKTRNLAVQTQDVTSLIQMILSVAYGDANQGLEPAQEKIAFYQEMQRKTQANLLEAKRLQGLLRSQRTDPLMSGSLLPVPANQRTLHRCQAVSEPPKLDCREVLVSTAPELDDFLSQTEQDAASAESEGRNAASTLEKLQQKRVQTLTELSETAGMMHNTALSVLQGKVR